VPLFHRLQTRGKEKHLRYTGASDIRTQASVRELESVEPSLSMNSWSSGISLVGCCPTLRYAVSQTESASRANLNKQWASTARWLGSEGSHDDLTKRCPSDKFEEVIVAKCLTIRQRTPLCGEWKVPCRFDFPVQLRHTQSEKSESAEGDLREMRPRVHCDDAPTLDDPSEQERRFFCICERE